MDLKMIVSIVPFLYIPCIMYGADIEIHRPIGNSFIPIQLSKSTKGKYSKYLKDKTKKTKSVKKKKHKSAEAKKDIFYSDNLEPIKVYVCTQEDTGRFKLQLV